MNQHDLKQLRAKLDQLAQHHPHKPMVIERVLQRIQPQQRGYFAIWKLTGFALAAAITGFVVLPSAVDVTDQNSNQVVVNPKLSPQMMEDLEMLSVLGEDVVIHGS